MTTGTGCFSGSALEHEGRLYLFYTGARYVEENPEDIHVCLNDNFVAAQMRITSEDGMHFDNLRDKRVVIPPLTDERVGCATHTRDPKVWRGKDAWYMILGTRRERTRGGVLFYRSRDLLNWEYVNYADKSGMFSWMWECPDYFTCEGGEVLIVSPIGLLKDGKTDGQPGRLLSGGFRGGDMRDADPGRIPVSGLWAGSVCAAEHIG